MIWYSTRLAQHRSIVLFERAADAIEFDVEEPLLSPRLLDVIWHLSQHHGVSLADDLRDEIESKGLNQSFYR